jgi:hypothetical protein
LLDQHPSRPPPERIDYASARQLIEVCMNDLPPYLRRVLHAIRLLALDMNDEIDCEIIAFYLRLKTSTLRSYKTKIRDRCKPLREKYVALFSEKSSR